MLFKLLRYYQLKNMTSIRKNTGTQYDNSTLVLTLVNLKYEEKLIITKF